jgi:uncharacterized protein (UPF0212 family)
MEEEFKCGNCNKHKCITGKINLLSALMLALFMICPYGMKICDECASKFNVIGFILAIFALVGLLIVLFVVI